jgi:DNA polymerase-3 subunit delta'
LSWANVPGHEDLKAAFRRVIGRGRLAHAYLFAGPHGVGKRRFAVELAKKLLCERHQGDEACDQCPACLQVAAGTHPDYQLVGLPADKHEFPIELMHELIARLALKPARGKHRVAIVDDADSFNEETANCFLKSLEEPPPRSLLVLLATNLDRQLPTIRSRCQLVRFGNLPEESMASQLVHEGLASAEAEARQFVRLAGGNLADARALADPAVRAFRRELLEGLGQARLDSVGLGQKLDKFAEEGIKESATKRQRASLALNFLVDFLRTALHEKVARSPGETAADQPPGQSATSSSSPLAVTDPDDAQVLRRFVERIDEDRLLRMLDRCLEADYQIGRRLQLVLILEALTDALAQVA